MNSAEPVRIVSHSPQGTGLKRFFSSEPIGRGALRIRGIGVRELMPPCVVERPKGTGDYLMMLFHDPVQIGTGPAAFLEAKPETMMLWPPGKGQYYGNRETGFNHSWIHCEGSRVQRIIRLAGIPVLKPFPVANVSGFQQALLDIHSELVSFGAPDEVILGNLIENCLREIARNLGGKEKKLGAPENLLVVRRLISTVPGRPIALEELARLAGMSVPYFCSKFKSVFGLSPMECLIQHRMHRAAHLLSDRNLTVSEIARQVGYEDSFHFSKMFRKHFGVSPRAMRNRLVS